MRLNSISANRHIFDGQANGKPLRLLLSFDSGRTLRLGVAGDGATMAADGGLLDPPIDMGEYGQTDIADVAQSLFPRLCSCELHDVQALTSNGVRVGVKLNLVGAEPFHFWVDGDELHWGDEAKLRKHDWLDKEIPRVSERIEI